MYSLKKISETATLALALALACLLSFMFLVCSISLNSLSCCSGSQTDISSEVTSVSETGFFSKTAALMKPLEDIFRFKNWPVILSSPLEFFLTH